MTPPTSRTEEHIGEWRVSIVADTLEGVFGELARVIAHAAGDPEGEGVAWESLEVSARDPATLLVDAANELIGRGEANGVAYDELANVSLVGGEGGGVALHAQVRGRRVAHWTSPLKAATYHALALEERNGRWRAQVLFDV